jgi:hypothetical protein
MTNNSGLKEPASAITKIMNHSLPPWSIGSIDMNTQISNHW